MRINIILDEAFKCASNNLKIIGLITHDPYIREILSTKGYTS
jgi:hypothetical protein